MHFEIYADAEKEHLSGAYHMVKQMVIDAGFREEIEWQETISSSELLEPDLLRQGAWVILCSGFSEARIRDVFDQISLCFCDWESARAIRSKQEICVRSALEVFPNRAKIFAIAGMAERICECSFELLRAQIRLNPLKTLQQFKYIGPVTSYHLAKNLGFEFAKPDRHLVRMASNGGFENVSDMCDAIANSTEDKKSVIDIVLWRYAVLMRSKIDY